MSLQVPCPHYTLVWYFREHIDGYHKPQRAAQLPGFMAGQGPKVCVLPTDQAAATFPNPPGDWHRVDVEGFNAGKGQWVKLTAFVKSGHAQTGLGDSSVKTIKRMPR